MLQAMLTSEMLKD